MQVFIIAALTAMCADLTGDGFVDIDDLAAVAAAYNTSCEPEPEPEPEPTPKTVLLWDENSASLEYLNFPAMQRWQPGDVGESVAEFTFESVGWTEVDVGETRDMWITGARPVEIDGRASSKSPELIVDGIAYPAVADTFLTSSLYGQTGPVLQSNGDWPVLLRFDAPPGEATLRLHAFKIWSGTIAPSKIRPIRIVRTLPPIVAGLSTEYPDDAGILDDPAVLMVEPFESEDWFDQWTASHSNIQTNPKLIDDGHSGQALRMTVPAGENLGGHLVYHFETELGAAPDAAYMRYYLRLVDGWPERRDNGKLPGLAGTQYGTAHFGGSGGGGANGCSGWSARGLFADPLPPNNAAENGDVLVGSYIYRADDNNSYGDHQPWGRITPGKWYSMETYVKPNTVGLADGVVRGWIDGRLRMEVTNVVFRHVEQFGLDSVWFNFYHGGRSVTTQPLSIDVDDVVVAAEYIGPMNSKAPRSANGGGTDNPEPAAAPVGC